MKRVRIWLLGLACCLPPILSAQTAPAAAPARLADLPAEFDDSTILLSPNVVRLLVGESQELQVLDHHGIPLRDAEFSVSDPGLAEVVTEDGIPRLHALAPGQVTLTARSGGRSSTADVRVFSGNKLPKGTVRWSLPVLVPGAQAIRNLQAVRVDDDVPDFYLQERSPRASYVRAVTAEGIQRWVWPAIGSQEKVILRCGDNLGGAVLTVINGNDIYAVVLDWKGHERWRLRTGPWWAYTYRADDMLVIVEDNQDAPQVTALDGRTGDVKLQVAVPPNDNHHLNFDWQPGGPGICAPGATRSITSPPSHGNLATDSDDNTFLTVSTLNTNLDAPGCHPGQPIDLSTALMHHAARIQLLKIASDLSYTWQTVREFTYDGPDWNHPVDVGLEWGSTIPDGNGGALISAKIQHLTMLTPKTLAERTLLYRVNGTEVVEYPLPVAANPGHEDDNMLLGEHDIGFYGGTKDVVAYQVLTGKILWIWRSPYPVRLNMALADGGVVVQTGERGEHLIVLDAQGKPTDKSFTWPSKP